MDSLPSEILNNIFTCVPFKERIECTLVCHNWYNILANHSLLYELDIYNEKIWNKFIKMLQHLPSRASQVEILKLDISPSFDKRILSNLLPNLRVYEYEDRFYHTQLENHCHNSFTSENLNSKLKLIKDTGECELTRQLLQRSSCNHITHLDLELNLVDNPRKEVFVHLKNTPALKHLILRYCYIGLEDLEMIHKDVPDLHEIELNDITPIVTEIPADIIPVTSVTSLTLYLEEPTNLDWYKYLAKKYTKLTHFDYSDNKMFHIDPRDGMTIYREGLYPIYRNLGIPLPNYNFINIPTDSNPVNILEECGIRVTNCNIVYNRTGSIFEQLSRSNISKYIESLKLNDTTITSPILLQNFTSLRELRIGTISKNLKVDVNLTHYFDAFPPTLTTFCAYFQESKINDLPSHPNNVQHLDLKCDTIHPKLGETISNCFPNLNFLYLKGRITENLSIDLPNNHFKQLHIDINSTCVQSYDLSLTNRNSSQNYIFIGQHNKPTNVEPVGDRINISLHYASAAKLQCGKLKIKPS